MSLFNSFDRAKHLEELGTPLVSARGVRTPQQRKQAVMDNLAAGFTSGAGTKAGATIAATEMMGLDGFRTTKLLFTNFSLGNGGDAAALGIGALAYTFPAGDIQFVDAWMRGAFSSTGAYTNVLDAGLGSVIASGVVSVLGGTATFEDFIGSLTTGALNAGGAVVGVSGSAAAAGIGSRVIAAAAAHTVHVNAAGTWTDIAAALPVLYNGVAVLRWRLLAST